MSERGRHGHWYNAARDQYEWGFTGVDERWHVVAAFAGEAWNRLPEAERRAFGMRACLSVMTEWEYDKENSREPSR